MPDAFVRATCSGCGVRLAAPPRLLPLLLSFVGPKHDAHERLTQVLEDHPEIFKEILDQKITSSSELMDRLIGTQPGNKLEGAYLSRDSKVHWLLALLAAGLFYGYLFAAFPRGQAKEEHLAFVALFTATVGIFLLLAFQFAASCTQGMWVRGTGVLTLLFYVVKFIGFSYNCALDPSNGFVASLFGFTLGVGLCEELTKALPVIWHFRKHATLDWRGSVIWGLMSGVGFGVSEAIHYCGEQYNGVEGGGIYVVRLISCVALHASWAGAAALIIWNEQTVWQGGLDWAGIFKAIGRTLWVVMLLHGLYDTCLKRDMNFFACVVAVASFGWFAWQYEKARRTQAQADMAFATA